MSTQYTIDPELLRVSQEAKEATESNIANKSDENLRNLLVREYLTY